MAVLVVAPSLSLLSSLRFLANGRLPFGFFVFFVRLSAGDERPTVAGPFCDCNGDAAANDGLDSVLAGVAFLVVFRLLLLLLLLLLFSPGHRSVSLSSLLLLLSMWFSLPSYASKKAPSMVATDYWANGELADSREKENRLKLHQQRQFGYGQRNKWE